MGTQFAAVYNRFLGKITDDLYMELTPEDTLRDLQRLLINALPEFEFPRKNLMNYLILTVVIKEDEATPEDFIVGVLWGDISEKHQETPDVLVDKSFFAEELTEEEINILAILMKKGWLQRQITSIENTRMKYSSADFKMTSQANHLSKLLVLKEDILKESTHMQRLYKRRRISDSGKYESNWSVLNTRSVLYDS